MLTRSPSTLSSGWLINACTVRPSTRSFLYCSICSPPSRQMTKLWRDFGGTKTAGFGQDKVGLSKLTPRSSRLHRRDSLGDFLFSILFGGGRKDRERRRKTNTRIKVGRLANSRLWPGKTKDLLIRLTWFFGSHLQIIFRCDPTGQEIIISVVFLWRSVHSSHCGRFVRVKDSGPSLHSLRFFRSPLLVERLPF